MRSIQVNNAHKCAGCGALYVPYDCDVPCPRCGTVEKQRCDFIAQAVRILLHNLEHHKTFLPDGWIAESFADYVLAILLQVFHAYTVAEPEESFYEFSRQMLEEHLDLDSDGYLLDHMHAMTLRMWEELRKQSSKEIRPVTAYPRSPLRQSHFVPHR